MPANKNLNQISINQHQSLMQLGWTPEFQTILEQLDVEAGTLARVTGVRKNRFIVSQGDREWMATAAGRICRQRQGLYPVTGDWVLLKDTAIYQVLPRKNALSRGAAGARGKQMETAQKEQVIAANLDTVFIVCGLDHDFNLRRIERYLTLMYNCSLNPAIVLTKADLHSQPEDFALQVEAVAFGVPVHLVSSINHVGMTVLHGYLESGRTIAMVGSSGAGKSTLVNHLYGKEIQTTGQISDRAGKGIHTTTTRDLIMMPQGGMVIDNPGIREIAFWDDDGGIEAAFPEIEKLSATCRFSDCSHSHEPGCRVIQAVDEGSIAIDRLESYLKMKRELTYLSQRKQKSADRIEKERWKTIAKKIKGMKKNPMRNP